MNRNTRKAYESDWRQFTTWCESTKSLASDPATIAAYIRNLTSTVYNIRTVERKLTGIAHYHREAGLPNPVEHERVKAVMKGIRRAHTIGTLRPLIQSLRSGAQPGASEST
jgi:site-specific recombinase XerD